MKWPNHALQRTATAVTACAADRRHLSAHRHRPRQPPPSLSLGSLGVLRPFAPRITPAMTNSEPNVTSDLNGYVSDALRSLDLLGFAHAGTLAAMRRVSPVCPSARMSVRVCASLSLSAARRLRTSSVRGPVCLPGGFPPTPQPQFVSQPPIHQHGPQHAAVQSAASIFARRSAFTRRGCRESERTPNHALQPTAPRVTVAAISGPHPSRPCVPFP